MKVIEKVFKTITFFICIILLTQLDVINSRNVQAAVSTDADSAINWVKGQINNALDYDGSYGAQCVDLIKYYYSYLGVSPVLGNGSDYTWNALPSGWQRIQGAVPQKGDILVYIGGYENRGHVAIFESTYSTYHQNYANNKVVLNITDTAYNGFTTTPYWGVIRPDFIITPTSVSLNHTNLKFSKLTSSITLTATVSPSDAVDKTVKWTSSDTSVATVDANGVVKPVGNGTATITATTNSGGKTAVCQVLVEIPGLVVTPTSVTLSPTAMVFSELNSTMTLTPTVLPSNATDKTVSYKSSNTSVATVDANGVVTSKGNGTATITVTTNSGAKTAKCIVEVNVKPTAVTLDKTNLSFSKLTSSITLTATVTPSNAADKTVKWASSDTSVATVDANGVVKPVGNGSATITVTTNSGGKTAVCKVVVSVVSNDGWIYSSSLPATVTSSDYDIQYKHTYEKYATTSPGTGWTDTGKDKTEYVKSGSTYISDLPLTTSNTVRLDSYYYYHFCGASAGKEANHYSDSLYVHYDEIRDISAVYEYASGADYHDNRYTYYHLKWNNGNEGYCYRDALNGTCDGSAGLHDGRSYYWYKMYVYQNYTASTLNLYQKVSDWISTKDASATTVQYRYREKTSATVIPTGVTLNKTTATLTSKGATVSLVATVTPSEAADKTVSWKSSNTSVATVDANGVVTAKGNGTATITVTTNSGSKTATCKVTVTIVPTEVSLNKTTATLTSKGASVSLVATVTPSEAADKTVSWKSSNTSVATVDSKGVVTAVGHGTAIITATTNSGGKTATCKVAVEINGLIKDSDGIWRYYKDGVVNTGYTGLVSYAGKNWYVQNGVLNSSYTNVVKIDGVYHYIKGGQFMSDYTGLASNANGTWYMQNGLLDFNYTNVVAINGVYHYIKGGQFMSDYTGLASNTNGTWYMQKGVLNLSFSDVVKTDGKWRYIQNGKYMSDYTGVAKSSDGNWYYIEKGVFNPSYTGLASNTNGTWYMQKGVLDFKFTDIVKTNGKWCYVKEGQFMSGYTGVAKCSDGNWYYIEKGLLNPNYTGLASNANGTWYMQKGVLHFSYTNVVAINGVYHYIKEGQFMSDYTGLASNANGTWYMQKGVLNLSFSDVVKTDGKWRYIQNGKYMSDYTGVAKSSDGNWYYIEKGVFNPSYTGLASNANGTWYMQKGVLNFGFTDIVKTNGKWCYIKEGQFMSGYTGVAKCSDGNWYYIEKGVINPNYTGLANNANGTWYIQKGVLDLSYTNLVKINGVYHYIKGGQFMSSYTGLVSNANGTWYVQKGVIDLSFSDIVKTDGKWCYIKEGQFMSGYTGVARCSDGNWYYIEKGVINPNYTGLSTNANGTWYVQKGVLDFKFSGSIVFKGITYKIVEGKVVS